MIEHLSSDQLSDCVLGQASRTVAQHVQHCPACSAALMEFRESLGEFQSAVRRWSDVQARQYQAGNYRADASRATPRRAPELSIRSSSHQLAWALLIAVVCVIASFVFPRHGSDLIGSDAALLNQVDAQVSRTTPSSMEPLMKLVVEEP